MDVTLFQFLLWGILLFLGMYRLLIYPIHQRCQRAFNHILAKEIARKLYQQMHPEFTYEHKYYPDDLNSQPLFNTTIETLTQLLEEKNA